jgi:hypothetical protein
VRRATAYAMSPCTPIAARVHFDFTPPAQDLIAIANIAVVRAGDGRPRFAPFARFRVINSPGRVAGSGRSRMRG